MYIVSYIFKRNIEENFSNNFVEMFCHSQVPMAFHQKAGVTLWSTLLKYLELDMEIVGPSNSIFMTFVIYAVGKAVL